MTEKRSWKACGIVATGLLLLSPAAGAQLTPQLVIPAGIDIFTTPDDGSTYLEDLYIAPGFFCPGSPGWFGNIPLKGKPLATSPANVLGTTDTVVHRTQSATFSGNTATVPIEVVGLSLVGAAPFSACGQTYNVVVCRDASQPPGSSITISLDGNLAPQIGGTFNAQLDVAGLVWFKNAGGSLGPLSDTISLTTVGAHWTNQVGPNGVDYGSPVQIDENCSGQASGPTYANGTSGFHPGWSWNPPPQYGCPTLPCHVPPPHDGPHGTVVPRPKRPCVQPVDIVVQLATASKATAEATSSGSLQFDVAQPCQIVVTDLAVTSTDGASCTTSDLVVLDDGSPRSFSVVSRDPCVLGL